MFHFIPYFNTIDDVLPEHVTAGTDGGHGIEIGVGHPNREGRVLLEEALTGIEFVAEVTADAATDEEECEAEHEAQHGDGEQQGQTGIAVDDVAHRDTRGDAELRRPEIERQVGGGDDPRTDTLGIVLHEPAQEQRCDKHHRQLLEDDDEGRPERQMAATLEQWEHGRDHQRRGEGGYDDKGRHRIDVAPDLRRDHRSSGRRRTDDAGEDALPEDLTFHTGLHAEDDPHVQRHQQHLRQEHTDMPAMRAHLVEVDAAERGEQRAEHHHREHRVDHLTQRIASGIEPRHPVEQEIDHRAYGYSHRQRPVFEELLHIHAAKTPSRTGDRPPCLWL